MSWCPARLLALALLFALGSCVSTPPGGGAPPPQAYLLPFEGGTRQTCVQSVSGPFSHCGPLAYAIDFCMDEGTPVTAARGGRVLYVKEDSNLGGPSKKYMAHANMVVVDHGDGTRGAYLHLRQNGACVELWDAVRRGQLIGCSGNTGWSAMPHLHFHVEVTDPQTCCSSSIPFRFADVRGNGVPAAWTTYQSGNAALGCATPGPR